MKSEYGFSFMYGTDKFSEDNSCNGKITIKNELEVTTTVESYDEYNSKYWVNEYSALSDTKVISNLNDVDIFINFNKKYEPKAPGSMYGTSHITVTTFKGANPEYEGLYAHELECEIMEKSIEPGQTQEYSCIGGRSANGTMPFIRINCGNSGIILAIGWTGQWKCTLKCTENGIHCVAGVEDAEFYMKKGERFRTLSAIVTEYDDGYINGHNRLRRVLKKRCIQGDGRRPVYADVSAMNWGAMKSDTMLRHIDGFSENDIGIECFWIDAGWYGHSEVESVNEHISDWSRQIGSWNVNEKDHPDGLIEVARKAHENNMRFLLWVEPERAFEGTDWYKEYPEYMLPIKETVPITPKPYWGNNILNIGVDGAWDLAYNLLCDLIERFKIDCYRQDFNRNPLDSWREKDADGRRGITEIKYINGLYKLFDKLLERFPDLYIDNCASGGRRNDIEMLSRSIPLWRNDYQCFFDAKPHISQAQNTGFSMLMPYSATGVCSDMDDKYGVRSCYGCGLNVHWWYTENNPVEKIDKLEAAKDIIKEFKLVRKYFSCDFYPLTPYSRNDTEWCIWQYNHSEEESGMVMAFRRENCPISKMTVQLNALKDEDYILTNLDTKEELVVKGSKLMNDGLEILLSEKRSSTIFLYELADKK